MTRQDQSRARYDLTHPCAQGLRHTAGDLRSTAWPRTRPGRRGLGPFLRYSTNKHMHPKPVDLFGRSNASQRNDRKIVRDLPGCLPRGTETENCCLRCLQSPVNILPLNQESTFTCSTTLGFCLSAAGWRSAMALRRTGARQHQANRLPVRPATKPSI